MTINRRKMLIGLGILPLVPAAVIARPYDGNLIKVTWRREKDKFPGDEDFECWFSYLEINGTRVGEPLCAMWRHGDIERMDSELERVTNHYKQNTFQVLRTHEYDPVIDNSTSDFYLE